MDIIVIVLYILKTMQAEPWQNVEYRLPEGHPGKGTDQGRRYEARLTGRRAMPSLAGFGAGRPGAAGE